MSRGVAPLDAHLPLIGPGQPPATVDSAAPAIVQFVQIFAAMEVFLRLTALPCLLSAGLMPLRLRRFLLVVSSFPRHLLAVTALPSGAPALPHGETR